MSEPTAEDRETARELQTAIVRGANPIPGAKRVEAWEIIAAAIADARENERERTLQGATVAQIQATPRRRLADQQARHEVELRALQSQIADLAQERDRLRGALKAPGLYPPTETPEAVAARHIKGVDQDPPLQPAEEPGP